PFTDFQYKLRATHYPSQPKARDDEFGIAPHTDTSFLTLLAPNDVPGLAFCTRTGDWIDVPTVSDAFIVNGGRCYCAGPTTVSSQRRTARSAADDRVYHLDHVPQPHRRSSLRQVADLILEPGHRLFARHGIEVVRIGMAGPLRGRQPQTFSAFDLIAEELEPVIDMNDPGLRRMVAEPEFVAED